jgi:hypothetical protein
MTSIAESICTGEDEEREHQEMLKRIRDRNSNNRRPVKARGPSG